MNRPFTLAAGCCGANLHLQATVTPGQAEGRGPGLLASLPSPGIQSLRESWGRRLAPPAAHAARGLSGGRQPPRRRRLLGRSRSSGDSGVEPPRYSPITPQAGSRSETAQGHSPAPPLRPAPPFRALQPCRISQCSATAGEETGGGEREVPRGAVCKARPSLLGVPARNHEWEPREARTLTTAAEGQAPALPATATGCHCSRAAEPARSRREDPADPSLPRPRGPAWPSPLEAPWCLDAVFRPPSTHPISQGLHPAHRLSMKSKLIIPLLRDGWVHCWGAARASCCWTRDKRRIFDGFGGARKPAISASHQGRPAADFQYPAQG
ncbi:proline-rich protein 33 [Bubalus bubalis]|uniref:proline-rich protein 33 n=1 Tax=Bubalus bubalis TaxID=89462 RepID=UPI001D0FD639|nr:proline-rich protein 33 [Bubalus bubalis]